MVPDKERVISGIREDFKAGTQGLMQRQRKSLRYSEAWESQSSRLQRELSATRKRESSESAAK